MGKNLKNIKEILTIAGIFMALNIGAGFTSGQEILQFFSGFGWFGFIGAIISFVIIVYGSESIIDAGWLSRNNPSISVFEYLGGSKIGTFYNILIPILLFGSYSIMLAGSGSLLQQFFNIPNFLGRILVSALAVSSIFLRFQSIMVYLGFIGKLVATIIGLLSLVVIFQSWSNISTISLTVSSFPIIKGSDSFYGAAMLYGGMVILASSQFLFDMGINLKERESGLWGIILGVSGFIGLILIIHFAILLYLSDVYQLPIITIYFAQRISTLVAFVVSLLLFITMYSASTISLWSVSNIIRKKFSFWKKRYLTIIVSLGVLGFFLSSVPFGILVNILYPINGFFGLFLILLIMYNNRKLVYSLSQDEKITKEE